MYNSILNQIAYYKRKHNKNPDYIIMSSKIFDYIAGNDLYIYTLKSGWFYGISVLVDVDLPQNTFKVVGE